MAILSFLIGKGGEKGRSQTKGWTFVDQDVARLLKLVAYE